jgi:hypothetical protein
MDITLPVGSRVTIFNLKPDGKIDYCSATPSLVQKSAPNQVTVGIPGYGWSGVFNRLDGSNRFQCGPPPEETADAGVPEHLRTFILIPGTIIDFLKELNQATEHLLRALNHTDGGGSILP